MEASLNQDRTIFIQETISGTNLMQGDFSNRRLIGSTVQSFKMQDGRCRYLRAQGTRFQNFSIDHVLCDQGNYQDCAWSGLEVRNSFLTGSHFSGCTFEVTMGELSSFGLSFFPIANSRVPGLARSPLAAPGGKTAGLNRKIIFCPLSLFGLS